MLSRARERARTINFQLGKAERLDFPSDFFDLMFSVDVIHQVGNRLAYFRTVEFAYQLTDIQAYRDKAFSALLFIPEEAFWRGIERMEQDLRTGPIQCVSRYLLLWGAK